MQQPAEITVDTTLGNASSCPAYTGRPGCGDKDLGTLGPLPESAFSSPALVAHPQVHTLLLGDARD